MPVSMETVRSLPFVGTVDQAVDSFLTEWQLTAHGALMSFAPNDNSDDTDRQWWIAFAGNMLWAWTVFVESGSPYGVVASLLGAALAGGVASKLQYQSSPDVLTSMGGTKVILNALAAQATSAEVAFKKGSKHWSDEVLVDYVLDQAASYLRRSSADFRKREEGAKEDLRKVTHGHPSDISIPPVSLLNDDELRSWFNGNDGGGGDEVIKSKIWSEFVFVSGTVKYETRRLDLRSYFVKMLDSLREQFKTQYELYEYYMRVFVSDRFRAGKMDGQESMRLYRATRPFVFKPYYGVTQRGDLLTRAFHEPYQPSIVVKIKVPGAGL